MTEDRTNTPCYIARCKCGCRGIVFATVDRPEYKEDVAKDVSEMILAGYAIEHVTVGFVKDYGFGCKGGQLELFATVSETSMPVVEGGGRDG